MDGTIDSLLKAAPLFGSIVVPLFAIIWKVATDRRDPGAVRRIRRHSDLYNAIPAEARPQLLSLIQHEVQAYSTSYLRKVKRHINSGTVAALIFVGGVTGALLYPTIYWGIRGLWGLWIVAGVIAFFGVALIIVGFQQLFTYEDESQGSASSKAKPRK